MPALWQDQFIRRGVYNVGKIRSLLTHFVATRNCSHFAHESSPPCYAYPVINSLPLIHTASLVRERIEKM